jgi:hypothetical protein
MKKNAHLHIVLESSLLAKLNNEAGENRIRLSELCRQKLGGNNQLENIEKMLQLLIKNLIKDEETEK